MYVVEVTSDKSAICAEILVALPQWFGLSESNAQYTREAETLPMFAVFDKNRAVGMVVMKQHTPHAAENVVLGVRPECHRRGIGRALIARGEVWARARGCRYVTVKTRGPSALDPNYEKTRTFYEAVGFLALEEFPTLWDAENPCLFMVKPLG